MYAFRKMAPGMRARWVAERKLLRVPWHAPAHFGDEARTYLITAACFEHQAILEHPERLTEWEGKLIQLIAGLADAELKAWVVLPNHYHVLAAVSLPALRVKLGRLHNGTSTQWNREDGRPGRKVWYRFTDRAIRSDRHLYATVNYIHANPVKHGLVRKASDWPWSSFGDYAAAHGVAELRRWWDAYPIDRMGEGWDDERPGG